MTIPKLGEPARALRLPSAQGGEVALDDYKGRGPVVLWFTKGMACPFCRQQMSQLARAYPLIKARGGEVLEVTSSPLVRGERYARQFKLPFPYLCDPDGKARAAWGLETRSHGPAYYAKTFLAAMKADPPPNDYGNFKPALSEVPKLLSDDDMGLFIIDRAGVVRYALAGPYFSAAGPHAVPGPEEIVRELDRCAAVA